MPSAERMLDEYARQADRERAGGMSGMAESFRCAAIVRALSDVIVKDMKVRIVRTK